MKLGMLKGSLQSYFRKGVLFFISRIPMCQLWRVNENSSTKCESLVTVRKKSLRTL